MLLNYFKLSLRLLARNPFFTAINVIGLAVGFAVFFVLWPYTQSELNSESFIEDRNQIFRTILDIHAESGVQAGEQFKGTFQATYLTSTLFDESQYTRFMPQDYLWPTNSPGLKAYLVLSTEAEKTRGVTIKLNKAICADKNLFDFFDLAFMNGNRSLALQNERSIVLSESMSRKIFGEDVALGKNVSVNGFQFQVSGIFQDIPANSHFNFDVVFSNVAKLNIWNEAPNLLAPSYHYVKTNRTKNDLEKFLDKEGKKMLSDLLNIPGLTFGFIAEPITDIVFKNYLDDNNYVAKSRFNLTMLSVVSLAVLTMAWMNYVNLTLSRTKNRFKEMAARKVSGAGTQDLFLQFICQSTVINVLAVLIGITIIQLTKRPFEMLLDVYIVPTSQYDFYTWIIYIIVVIAGILICALYPAWMATRFTTRQLIGHKVAIHKQYLPSLLTTVQYVTALVLIILIIISHSQLNYILSKDLGIDKKNVVVIEAPVVGMEEKGVAKMTSFADRLKLITGISEITLSGRVPGDNTYSSVVRKPGSDQIQVIDTYGGTDENFLAFYGLNLLAGRNFQRDEKPDVVMLSKHAAVKMGFSSPEDAIGNYVEINNYDEPYTKAEIVGVFSDYRVMPFLSTQNESEDANGRGQLFSYLNNLWKEDLPERISIRIPMSKFETFLKKAEKLYTETFPGNVFIWYFLDDHIAFNYKQQTILRNQISFFTILAVGVACLGLLGMITNKVADKTKEIGIRRILGAHDVHITYVLLDSAIRQVIFAVVIGIPLAWKLSEQFLMRYSTRIELQWWHYSVPVVILSSIMMMTIASLLWRVTKSNPVEALKYE